MSRAVTEARATGGASQQKRTVRVTRYETGWGVVLGIGGRDPDRPARASVELDPDQARAVAGHLLEAADRSEQARKEAADA